MPTLGTMLHAGAVPKDAATLRAALDDARVGSDRNDGPQGLDSPSRAPVDYVGEVQIDPVALWVNLLPRWVGQIDDLFNLVDHEVRGTLPELDSASFYVYEISRLWVELAPCGQSAPTAGIDDISTADNSLRAIFAIEGPLVP